MRTRYRPEFDHLESRCLMSLDPTFGSGGIATTDFAAGTNDYAWDTALQSDGKIVAVGFSATGSLDFALSRSNPDGSLDTSFGTGGRVLSDFGGSVESANAVVVQPDGKIVVAGSATPGGGSTGRDVALARYNPDGSLDTSFGSGGFVTTNTGFSVIGGAPDDDEAFDVALQPDGKIVAVGIAVAATDYGTTSDFLVIRYNGDGSLDGTFGALDPSSDLSGVVTTNFGGGVPVGFAQNDIARAVAVGADGRITVVGGTFRGSDPSVSGIAIARYASDGAFDSTQHIALDVGSPGLGDGMYPFDQAKTVVLLGDGSFVVGGAASSASGMPDMFLARYLPTGVLDPSFGTGGVTVTSFGTTGDLITSLAVQPDGKLVAAGMVGFAGWASGPPGIDPLGDRFYSAGNVMLLRYNTGGSLDTGFDGDGWFAPTPGLPGAHLNAVALQPDGKILAAGFQPIWGSTGFDFLALRFEAEDAVVNDPPVAVADIAATTDTTPITIFVLANDSDPDGDPLTITDVTSPAAGSVSISGDSVVYTPAVNFSGSVDFSYTISDGHGGTATATVTITVDDVTPPQVLEVSARGTGWSVPAYGIPVGAGTQLLPLPWVNLNQVSIRFSEDVSVPAAALELTGVRIRAYRTVGFGYDPATHTATWTLSRPFAADKVLLDLSDAVADASGNHLDGEWTNPTSVGGGGGSLFPSGDGTAGGRFRFRFDVQPGDVNQSGKVTMLDPLYVSSLIRSGAYDLLADLNGDGHVDRIDLRWSLALLGYHLTVGVPRAR